MKNKSIVIDSTTISFYLLLLAGIIGIIAFFLPFFETRFFSFSGMEEVKFIFQGIFSKRSEGRFFIDSYLHAFSNSSVKTLIGMVISIFVIFGPLLYGIISIKMIFVALDDRQIDGALTRAIIYIVVSFVSLLLMGDDMGFNINLFDYVGSGFWLGNFSLLLAFIASQLD